MTPHRPAPISVPEYEQRGRATLLLYTALGALSADAILFSHLGPLGFLGLPSLAMFLFLTLTLSYRVLRGRFRGALTLLAIAAPLVQGAVLAAVASELLTRSGF